MLPTIWHQPIADRFAFVDRMIFNYLIGNADHWFRTMLGCMQLKRSVGVRMIPLQKLIFDAKTLSAWLVYKLEVKES